MKRWKTPLLVVLSVAISSTSSAAIDWLPLRIACIALGICIAYLVGVRDGRVREYTALMAIGKAAAEDLRRDALECPACRGDKAELSALCLGHRRMRALSQVTRGLS